MVQFFNFWGHIGEVKLFRCNFSFCCFILGKHMVFSKGFDRVNYDLLWKVNRIEMYNGMVKYLEVKGTEVICSIGRMLFHFSHVIIPNSVVSWESHCPPFWLHFYQWFWEKCRNDVSFLLFIYDKDIQITKVVKNVIIIQDFLSGFID